ncbi:hypothetical protein OEZ85_010736 [Tetradesmus obliquus]|uniref:S1 motif domain-containing protein n=1 Tax=Tetradesmus obliquus TaxID=3088 RepID=A0ABY8TSV7_TETOB|nr:hypothetical protein OEZ85_010736 [Tetradesmus obliquus]
MDPIERLTLGPKVEAEVINLKHGITLRKDVDRKNDTSVFTMAGLPLKRSRPCQEEWFIRGVRVLGACHIQLLCSPELPPELAAAKFYPSASMLASRRKTRADKEQQEREHWAGQLGSEQHQHG